MYHIFNWFFSAIYQIASWLTNGIKKNFVGSLKFFLKAKMLINLTPTFGVRLIGHELP
jgi:hypothetical protein